MQPDGEDVRAADDRVDICRRVEEVPCGFSTRGGGELRDDCGGGAGGGEIAEGRESLGTG